MIILLLMLTVIIAVMAIYNIHSKFNGIFILMMTGVFVMIFSLVLYITKAAYYNGIFGLEVWIYRALCKLHMDVSTVKGLLNFGYGLIFTAQLLIFRETSGRSQKNRWIFWGSAGLALAFLIVNSPYVAEGIYLNMSEYVDAETTQWVNALLVGLDYGIILYFMILPVVAVTRSIQTTRLDVKRHQNLTFLAILILLEVIILLLATCTKIRSLMNLFMLYMFLSGRSGEIAAVMPFSLAIVLAVMTAVIIRFDLFNTVDFMGKRVSAKKLKVLVMDLKYIFHDFKNMMMTMIALKSIATTKYGTDEGREALEKIEQAAYGYSEKIGQLLDIYRNDLVVLSRIDLVVCLQTAIGRVNSESIVPIRIENLPECAEINGDAYQIETLFYNILKNAVESVEHKRRKVEQAEGDVSIEFIEEDEWLCVQVTDSGGGIDKKALKQLWKPFHTAKNSFMNWGIGLHQARNIMDAHLGQIDIKSKKDVYTKVQMSFRKQG